jgi:metal-responsive CopG/Arc/MetJ family transcriptional regulator
MEHRTIKIPEELLEKIEKTINKNKLGYTSTSEFIKEAIRHELGESPNGHT